MYYPNLYPSSKYLLPRVKIEIGSRSLKEPFSIQTFASLVDDAYPNSDFAQEAIQVPTVNPERTFLEKIFLLHEEFQRPSEKMRVERLSRHLYDIFKLSTTKYAYKALESKELYRNIVQHRYFFNRIGNVNYNLHQPSTINFIPPIQVMGAWKDDYKTMLEEMIYEENPPSFDELLSGLTALKDKINALDWSFDIEFPLKK